MTASAPELRDLARSFAHEGAELAREMRREGIEVADTKTSAVDVVTEADRAGEELIRARIIALRPDDAIAHGLRLAAEGAAVLDVGGESTRPRADTVPEEEEIRRVVPVIEALASAGRCVISIDTQKPGVARAALRAGAAIVNDISGLQFDAKMAGVCREAGAGVIAMHIQGTPQTMQDDPCYGDEQCVDPLVCG